MYLNVSIAFLLGLLSSIHCLGMCGGIIGALSLGLPESIRDSRYQSCIMVSGYNLGRIFSYTCAGAISGSMGLLLLEVRGGLLILRITAGTVLVLLGLNIGGWLPRLSILEQFGLRAWRVIQPLGKRFLPVDSFPRAFMIGVVWGWLPCGLVYSILLWAVASGGPAAGSSIMMCFGLGTLPALITTGMAAGLLQKRLQQPLIRRTFAVIIILSGIASPLLHIPMHTGDSNGPAASFHQHEQN